MHLAHHPVPNAWRVLMSDGSVSPSFRWEASGRTDDPKELLASEGIVFLGGRADPAQRITGAELAGLLGMDTGDLPRRREHRGRCPGHRLRRRASSPISWPRPTPTA